MTARTWAVLLAACALTACGWSDGDAPSQQPQPQASPARTSPASSEAPGNPAPELPPPLPAKRVDRAEFFSPSRNLACHLGDREPGDFVGCQIGNHDYPNPVAPADCEGDLLPAVWMGDKDVVTYGMCRGDPFAVPQSVLDYGVASVHGGYACLSERRGVTCWSTASEHGFFISSQSYTVF